MARRTSHTTTPALARGRRGRPTIEAVAVIDAAITAAAWRMFLDEGYGATSMDAVARQAGVSKGTLYARFDSKATLFSAVIAQQVAAWSEQSAQQNFRLGPTLEERLTRHATVFLDRITAPEVAGLNRLVIAESARFPELGRIVYEKAFLFGVDVIAQEIETALSGSRSRARDARAVAHTLVESISGWANLQAILNERPSAAARRKVARHRVALLLKGQAAWNSN